MLGILLALGLAEAVTLHLVAAAWWGRKVGIALGLLDLGLFGSLVALLRAFWRYPVTLDGETLVLRTGRRMAVTVAVADIAGLRENWTAADLKAPGVLNLALASWPNIVLDLRHPVRRRRRAVTAVAHRLDDPAVFRAALLAAIAT